MLEALDEKSKQMWRVEYERRLVSDASQGLLDVSRSSDRREAPRLRLNPSDTIWIHNGWVSVPVVNLSRTGLACHSEREFFMGDSMVLKFGLSLVAEAQVLGCEIEETDPNFMECRYKIRVQYGKRENGYKIYVLARDFYAQNLSNPIHLPLN